MMFFLLGAILGFSVRSFSQIQGDVLDQKEKGISNATLIITQLNTKLTDTVKTDIRGFYSFKNLKPSKYRMEVKAPGYKTVVFENIEIKEGENGELKDDDLYAGQRLDITLSPGKSQ